MRRLPPPPVDTDGPRVVSLLRYGYHMMPTTIVLTFDQALDAVTAEDSQDYRIIGPAGRTIAIKKAVYDAADLTVSLYPVARINIHHAYKLIVDGTSPRRLDQHSRPVARRRRIPAHPTAITGHP